jgi:hypothetical protein
LEFSRTAKVPFGRRILINAFLLFHIVAITCWCIPLNSTLLSECRALIRPYMLWSGLFQTWNMFAPVPKRLNAYIEASVILTDGQVQTWPFPRMEKLGYFERYRKERYNKFAENLREDAKSGLWPDAARYVARLYKNPSNPPKIIVFVRYWSEIRRAAWNGFEIPEEWHQHVFFEYDVQPEDLR